MLNRRQKGYGNIALAAKALVIKRTLKQKDAINEFSTQIVDRRTELGG